MMDLPVAGEQLAGWQAGPAIAACLALQALRPAAGNWFHRARRPG
jgi:hypothetical protein